MIIVMAIIKVIVMAIIKESRVKQSILIAITITTGYCPSRH